MPPDPNVAMEMAILDLANFEPIGAGHGSRQKVHQAEAVPGSNHRNQGGWMVGDNAERRLEAARKHRGQRLVANRLVGKRIADRSWAMRPGRNSELALTKLAIVTRPATELCVERRSEIVSSMEATIARARGSSRFPASVNVRGRSRRSIKEHPRACSRLAT